MTDYVREHTVGDLLSSSVAVYRQHFKSFFVAYAVPALPLPVLQAEFDRGGKYAAALFAAVANFLVVGTATGAITVMVSDACLGRPVSARHAYRLLFAGRVGKVIRTTLLVGLAIVGSLLLLVLPFFIVYPSTMIAVPVAVLEGKGAGSAFRRSWRLSKGLRWRNLGVFLLALFVVVALIIGVSLSLGILLAALSTDESSTGRILSIAGVILGTLIVPAVLVLNVLLYYDSRVRHEGYDSAALSSDLHW